MKLVRNNAHFHAKSWQNLLHLTREDETNVTCLSLLNRLSKYLLRTELDELEDGGMAELLTINYNLSQLKGITVNASEPGAKREENKSGEVNTVQREMPKIGKGAVELFSAMPISPLQHAGNRQRYVDHGQAYSPNPV